MDTQIDQFASPVERMVEQFTVQRVFGEVIREGDTAVVPVAEVASFFGYGYGSGEGPAPAGEGETTRMASGGGGGAGGRGAAKPRGYITITPDGVRYEPMMDPFKLALAGIVLTAWMVFWAALAIRAFLKE